MSDELGIGFTPEAFQSLICAACGRSFDRPNAYSNHIGSCRLQKKRTANALGAAKERYRNKKARLDTIPAQLILGEPSQSTNVTAGATVQVRTTLLVLHCDRKIQSC